MPPPHALCSKPCPPPMLYALNHAPPHALCSKPCPPHALCSKPCLPPMLYALNHAPPHMLYALNHAPPPMLYALNHAPPHALCSKPCPPPPPLLYVLNYAPYSTCFPYLPIHTLTQHQSPICLQPVASGGSPRWPVVDPGWSWGRCRDMDGSPWYAGWQRGCTPIRWSPWWLD